MAIAQCTVCRKRVRWTAARGRRLADMPCTACGGPLRSARASDAEILDPVSETPYGVPEGCLVLAAEVADDAAEDPPAAEFSVCRHCALRAECRPGRSAVGDGATEAPEAGGEPRGEAPKAAAEGDALDVPGIDAPPPPSPWAIQPAPKGKPSRSGRCPRCGGSLKRAVNGRCGFCKRAVT